MDCVNHTHDNDFQRARSEEQRMIRRSSILKTTRDMLAEMPVAAISLNEISRRVGLAKSNVLRYFESREAILFEVLDDQLRNWADQLDQDLVGSEQQLSQRIDETSKILAQSVSRRPVMCDLISAQAAVLERNISTQVAIRHKRAILEQVKRIVLDLERQLPELSDGQAYQIISYVLLMTAGSWPQIHPTSALQAAYKEDRQLAATQMDFTQLIRDLVVLTTNGILTRVQSKD